MTNKESFPSPSHNPSPDDDDLDIEGVDKKEAKKAEAIAKRDFATEEDPENEEEEEEHSAPQKEITETLQHSQRVAIDQKYLDKLFSTGMTIIPYVDLAGRTLQPGEIVILIDEDMKEHKAEFVRMVTKGEGKYGAKMEVCLPKSQ